jgi:hypothetical protein
MKFFISFIYLILFFSLNGQVNQQIDTLYFKTEFEETVECDTTILINNCGEIDFKLIFFQPGAHVDKGDYISIPHSSISNGKNKIALASEPYKSKKFLSFGYDTCYFSNLTEDENDWNFSEFVKPVDTSTIKNWNTEIYLLGNLCLDTRYHKVIISKNTENQIAFSCLHNIQIFESDLNRDGNPELYLISYIWCASKIRVYRIDIKK